MSNDKFCKNCIHSKDNKTSYHDRTLECRRYPEMIAVDDYHWCSEFKEKEDEQRTGTDKPQDV